MEDCCAWELLQLFYMLLPRMEGLVTQVCLLITCFWRRDCIIAGMVSATAYIQQLTGGCLQEEDEAQGVILCLLLCLNKLPA